MTSSNLNIPHAIQEVVKLPTFLKWAGGKRSIISKLSLLFPRHFNNYYEPFLGGGSVFFFVKQHYAPRKCVISDVNADLINTYKTVQQHPNKLIDYLSSYKKQYSAEFYYELRDKYNYEKSNIIERSAMFIFLNKSCFNGLYRVNSKNKFNVPFGHYKNPQIFDQETILAASALLKGVAIRHQDYRNILDSVSAGDFVYLDPCYDPITKTSFDKYTPKRFTSQDRMELAKFIYMLRAKRCLVMLSNNDVPAVRNLYRNFEIRTILAPRYINSKGHNRGKIRELAVRNFG